MLKILPRIKTVEDVKELEVEQLPVLANDIRKFLIQSIGRTGGHLASNLGVVELTIAMHYVFDSPKDKFIFDVGHQAYVHKLLTGRRVGFKELRKFGGMSGFPKRRESEHDIFETGHSSTSISAALGMAAARDLDGEDYNVVAMIGDGALTGGMAFEALNNAGKGHNKLIVILNDNEMSISENVGGISKYLTTLRSAKEYIRAKEDVENLLGQVPVVGGSLVKTAKRTKHGVKSFLISDTMFEDMGITYLGPIDGHNLDELMAIMKNAKEIEGPVVIHVKTVKGRGYRLAEQNPGSYHGIGPFDVKTGKKIGESSGMTFSDAFGEAMINAARQDKKVVAITAAMAAGTGLLDFSKEYPKRCFDVGIAEQHGVTFAAGLAMQGYKPVVAIYSSFLQRAYDQVLHDVALQNLPVIFAIDRAGLVGEDGSTHQGIFDIAYLSHIPNMTILSPKSPQEIESALNYALNHNAPIAIRYPRGGVCVEDKLLNDYSNLDNRTIIKGQKVALLATGKMVMAAIELVELLKEYGIEASLYEAPCVYPIDEKSIDKIANEYKALFTIEDHILEGGFGEKVATYIKRKGYSLAFDMFGYSTGIIEHGSVEQLMEQQGVSPECMKDKVISSLRRVD